MFAEAEADLLIAAAASPASLAAMAGQRAAGLPLEHILGWAEFRGLRVAVGPGVFVPRPRTEFLVEQAIALAGTRPVVVDLCCGSGALGLALTAAVEAAELHAADVDPAALEYARRNLGPAGGRVHAGDLYAALPPELRGRVTLLLANVPYVPTAEVALLPPEASRHEPRAALDGGADGLDVLRRVAAGAPQWLAPGGHMLSEVSQRQAPQAAAILAGSGLAARIVTAAGSHATVVIGSRPAGGG